MRSPATPTITENTKHLLRGRRTIDKIGRFCLPIKSAKKKLSYVVQKSSDFIAQHRTRSIIEDKISQLFEYRWTDLVCFHGDCLQWEIIFLVISFVYYSKFLLTVISCRKNNNASIIFRSAFCCCAFMKIYLISYEVANDKIGRVSWVNDFIGRFSRATTPRPQKLANFIDRRSDGPFIHTDTWLYVSK